MAELSLDLQKQYKMPTVCSIVSVDNTFLVISRETANWLLLHNQAQLDIFKFLSEGHSIGELFETFAENAHADIMTVLIELEAKHFEETNLYYPQEHGMYIYLTNQCNQRCTHCYMCAGEAMPDEMTTYEIKVLLNSFSEANGEVVTFTGGEPTLRTDFVELVRFAKSLGLKICVLSNGLCWTQELVSQVAPYLDEVQISVDGFDATSYMSVRNMDGFERALGAVNRLVSAKVKTMIAISPLLETLVDNEEQYVQFAKGLVAKYSEAGLVVKFNTEMMDGRNVHLSNAENMQYREISNRMKTACSPLTEEYGFALDHRGNVGFNNCGYGGICVSATGGIFFCNLIERCAKQANIRTHTFAEILQKSMHARLLSDVQNLQPCSLCDLKYLCGGGCRIKHFENLVALHIDSEDQIYPMRRMTPCTEEYKNRLYRLMISSNQLFYR